MFASGDVLNANERFVSARRTPLIQTNSRNVLVPAWLASTATAMWFHLSVKVSTGGGAPVPVAVLV